MEILGKKQVLEIRGVESVPKTSECASLISCVSDSQVQPLRLSLS